MVFITSCQDVAERSDRIKVALVGQKAGDLDFVIRGADEVASHIAEFGKVGPVANNAFDEVVGAPFDGDTLW